VGYGMVFRWMCAFLSMVSYYVTSKLTSGTRGGGRVNVL